MSTPELDVIDVEPRRALVSGPAGGGVGRRAGEQRTPFVGVVSADLGPESAEILAALRPGLQEIVCFDSLAEPVVTGQDFAMSALEEGRFGQDFVFTVPALEERGRLRRRHRSSSPTTAAGRAGSWSSSGPPPVLERAHRRLTEPA